MTAITMPPASVTMEEGKIVKWLASDGAQVEQGTPLVEVETDKAVVEVEAPATGRLAIVSGLGSAIRVGSLLGHVLGEGEELPPEPAADDQPSAKPASADPAGNTSIASQSPTSHASNPGSGQTKVSPVARRMAEEYGIDLAQLVGTGPGGRLQKSDVEAAIVAKEKAREAVVVSTAPGGTDNSSLRKSVVQALNYSWQNVPHINITGELNAEPLVKARAILNARKPVVKFTVTDLLLFCLGRALQEVPSLNGTVAADGTIALHRQVNIGLAVANSGGVVAPVIAAGSLVSIAASRENAIAAVLAGTLDKRSLGGAGITLSNLGNLPVDLFTPVISTPQIALVATGRVRQRPVVINDGIHVGNTVWVNIAIDHRAADGEAGGRLLAALQRQFDALPAVAQSQE